MRKGRGRRAVPTGGLGTAGGQACGLGSAPVPSAGLRATPAEAQTGGFIPEVPFSSSLTPTPLCDDKDTVRTRWPTELLSSGGFPGSVLPAGACGSPRGRSPAEALTAADPRRRVPAVCVGLLLRPACRAQGRRQDEGGPRAPLRSPGGRCRADGRCTATDRHEHTPGRGPWLQRAVGGGAGGAYLGRVRW